MWQINNESFKEAIKLSGIFTDFSLFKKYISDLLPGSFGIWYRFKLNSPYYSHDDESLYILEPIMKEKVWQVPIFRASSWKGVFLKAACKKLNEYVESEDYAQVIEHFIKIGRIFGTGSREFREVEEKIIKSGDKQTIITKLIMYSLKELGLNLMFVKNDKSIARQFLEQLKAYFTVRRGRAIFYPTYFNKLTLEVINPHNRRTKAGEKPIYYEVVPKDTEGIFQLIYIPYDLVPCSMRVIKVQTDSDIHFLKLLLKDVLEEYGIGAKEKLGWGLASVDNTQIKSFSNLEGRRV
jgi:CRISPR-associated protein Cmr2